MDQSPPHSGLPSRSRARAALAAALLPPVGLVAFALAPSPAYAQGDQTVRRVAGDRAVVDARGKRWAPASRAFQGGKTVRVLGWEPQTGSPGLYRFAKLGVRTISLRVPRPGRYAVVLYLADPVERSHRRTFDIYSGSRRVRKGVDVFVRGRERRVLHSLLETVVRGRTLRLKLRGRSGGAPVVSAISATRLGGTGMAPVRPTWQEDFNGPAGTRLNGPTWTYETGAAFAHDEQQAYTDRAENASLDGAGNLALTARQETYTIAGVTRQWTSGRVRLLPPLQLRRAEVTGRMRFPAARGVWATFWLYGLEPPKWPFNGEANVVEYNGNKPNVHHTFFHYGRATSGGQDGQLTGHTSLKSGLSGRFHEYGVVTSPGAMEFRFDGRRHASATEADVPRGAQWPLNNRFNLILSLAVGGDFLDDVTPQPSELPTSLLIDRLSYGQ
jgi:Glycosyl hydrolases family 16/Malectin domain